MCEGEQARVQGAEVRAGCPLHCSDGSLVPREPRGDEQGLRFRGAAELWEAVRDGLPSALSACRPSGSGGKSG